jgi:hypothetical protein
MILVGLAIVRLDVGGDIGIGVSLSESFFDLLNAALFLAVLFC